MAQLEADNAQLVSQNALLEEELASFRNYEADIEEDAGSKVLDREFNSFSKGEPANDPEDNLELGDESIGSSEINR